MKETSIARPQRRRAVGKTDRHSKIYTAQGARDRRMRLSLPIARRFFDLQDMLGFDKASKTIEWLFQKSKSAIKDALNITHLPDDDGVFISEKSEVVVSVGGSGEEIIENDDKVRSTRIGDKDPMVARECRDKARARARERTREKMMIANGQHNPSINASSSSSSSSSFSSIIMDYTVVHDSHTHQNPRAPSSSNIPQDLQLQSSAWDEYSNIGTRYGNNSFY
ncbi:unnamed protein product [Linum tenue]|uniref:Uncharacterized protein n=1 Tax=Linum tenue TaxID=586396 RepID=A0AAV0NKV0_9ROSI|nr:unnamed protein product [Linum tenue]